MEAIVIILFVIGVLAFLALQGVRRARIEPARILLQPIPRDEAASPARGASWITRLLRGNWRWMLESVLALAVVITVAVVWLTLLKLGRDSLLLNLGKILSALGLAPEGGAGSYIPIPPADELKRAISTGLAILGASTPLAVGVILLYRWIRKRQGAQAEPNLLLMPTRLYEGDSSLIVLRLGWRAAVADASAEAPLSLCVIHENGRIEPLGMEVEPGFKPKHISAELLAVGFAIDGADIQKHEIQAMQMIYQWNISAPKSGSYELGLVFRAEDESGGVRELGVITNKITVVKIAGLTSRHLWVLTSISGIFTGVLGVLEVLKRLGIVSVK